MSARVGASGAPPATRAPTPPLSVFQKHLKSLILESGSLEKAGAHMKPHQLPVVGQNRPPVALKPGGKPLSRVPEYDEGSSINSSKETLALEAIEEEDLPHPRTPSILSGSADSPPVHIPNFSRPLPRQPETDSLKLEDGLNRRASLSEYIISDYHPSIDSPKPSENSSSDDSLNFSDYIDTLLPFPLPPNTSNLKQFSNTTPLNQDIVNKNPTAIQALPPYEKQPDKLGKRERLGRWVDRHTTSRAPRNRLQKKAAHAKVESVYSSARAQSQGFVGEF